MQCWSGEDGDTHHHRLCPGTAPEGETGGRGWDNQTPPHSENEDGPEPSESVYGYGLTVSVYKCSEWVIVYSGECVHVSWLLLWVKQRSKLISSPFATQEQFIFIHDAILEELVCGETQIDASGFTAAMDDLSQQHILTNTTGFEKQFKVIPLTQTVVETKQTASVYSTRVCKPVLAIST